MATQTLEHFRDSSEINAASAEIRAKHLKKTAEQKEALASSTELRQTIKDVLEIRKSLGDPSVANIDSGSIDEYQDFDSARLAMRRTFDFRTKPDGTYGERWEADESVNQYFKPGITPDHEVRIYGVAEQFGLTGDTVPENPEADAALVLGGGGRSPLERTLYAKELIDKGLLKTNRLVSLGSERAVNEAERQRGGDYAADAETEFDLMVAAIETAYGITIDQSDIEEWIDHNVEHDIPKKHKVVGLPADEATGRPEVFIVSSAIVTDPFVDATKDGHHIKLLRNRANSADTFKTFSMLDDAQKVVAVTNAHFRPFQGAAAAKQMGELGIDVEVVGFDPQHFGNPPKKSHELVQEMLSTADSLAASAS